MRQLGEEANSVPFIATKVLVVATRHGRTEARGGIESVHGDQSLRARTPKAIDLPVDLTCPKPGRENKTLTPNSTVSTTPKDGASGARLGSWRLRR